MMALSIEELRCDQSETNCFRCSLPWHAVIWKHNFLHNSFCCPVTYSQLRLPSHSPITCVT
ncbi:hypothetical protein CRM22_001203 [Opisthorchis felineus]|uniref:Uncharacterized protein n=1 Tax=Opisthorchis felineus TaxID=147828 RepID=A0A4S2MI83_OPIFE|nr:hypothetical protein CRM22_001203 [Opisthorchis felineus]